MTGRAAWGAFGRRLGYDHAAMRTHPPLLLALSLAAPAVAHQFTPTTLPMPVQLTTDSRLGDLDGDGTLEVTLISALGPRVYRHAGNGAMVDLTAGMPAVTGNQRTAAFVDTDGDGSHELLLTWTNSARLFAFGAAGWSERSHLLPPGIPTIHGASAGDLDGDGDQDLVIVPLDLRSEIAVGVVENRLQAGTDIPDLALVEIIYLPERMQKVTFLDWLSGKSSGRSPGIWFSSTANAADFDGDGVLELVLAVAYGDFAIELQSQLTQTDNILEFVVPPVNQQIADAFLPMHTEILFMVPE
jgi:hypothetical protein